MPVRRLLPALAAALFPLAALEGQQPRRTTPGPAAAAAAASVRGVLYDSLIRAPLPGAHVWIVGTGFGTITDAAGRFRIDSAPTGRRIIAFEHPDLDSVGLSNNARRIDIAAGRPLTIDLATPSHATMYRAACGAGSPARSAQDSGVVLGGVEDVGSRARLAGARVRVSWVAVRSGSAGVEVSRPGIDVVTDSVGNYYACGVPKEYIVTIAASAGRFRSGVTEALLGARGVSRRDLGVSRDTTEGEDSTGIRSGRAILVGTITDTDGRPRPGARAAVDDAAGETITNEDGFFMLRGLPAGSHTLMVRMVGYAAVRLPVLLRSGDTTRAEARLRPLTVLDTIRVTAGPIGLDFDELQRRLRSGNAFVLSGEEVKRRISMRSVVQSLPSMRVEGASVNQFTMATFVAGRFRPVTLYVDGMLATTESIQSYRPDQIIAVEWYPRGASAPTRYQSLREPDAGVLLVWTRFIR